jgi:hypothetical protein
MAVGGVDCGRAVGEMIGQGKANVILEAHQD